MFFYSALVYLEADAANYTFERDDGSKGVTLNLVQKEFNLLKNGKTEEEIAAAANSQ